MRRFVSLLFCLLTLTSCIEAEQSILHGPLAWVYSLVTSSGFQFKYVAVGENALAYVSQDGLEWSAVEVTEQANVRLNAVIYTGVNFVAVGSDNIQEKIFYSTDGADWTEANYIDGCNNTGGASPRELFDIAQGNDGTLLAVGQDDAVPPATAACFLHSSDDGLNWSGGGDGSITESVKHVEYFVSMYLITIDLAGTTASYQSTDGINFSITAAPNPLNSGGKGSDVGDILFIPPDRVIVVGIDSGVSGSPKLSSTSNNGASSWAINVQSIFAGNTTAGDDIPRGLAYDGTRLVAVGDNCLIDATTDIENLNWSGVTDIMQAGCSSPDWRNLVWDGSKFIAVGGDGSGSSDPWIATSATGIGNSWSIQNAIGTGSGAFLSSIVVRP